jgi:P-type E1-E2 ATPase
MAAIGQAAKHGVIIKSGDALERMGKVDIVAFDKTGTLTMNRMTIQRVWATGHEPTNAQDEFNKDEQFLVSLHPFIKERK